MSDTTTKSSLGEEILSGLPWVLYLGVFVAVVNVLVRRIPALQKWNSTAPESFFFVFFFGPLAAFAVVWGISSILLQRSRRKS